jgi:NAD(P)-dependent dehydrogenase (short-subunit alcohol dehydrogenase family)
MRDRLEAQGGHACAARPSVGTDSFQVVTTQPADDPLDLSGRVVLVTGGTRGVGLGIAEGFLGARADVVVCGRTAPASPVAAGDREAVFLTADVRDADQVVGLFDQIASRYGRLDVAVNNAGGSPVADAATASPRFSAAIVGLNLLAPLQVAQAANAVMQGQAEGGSIINITSVSGTRPSPGTAAYGAAKAGLINLTESLAAEWAPKVRVNAVCGGAVATENLHKGHGGDPYIESIEATVPMGRLADVADIANACRFLASPLAAYVSGSNLFVHGGGEVPPFLLLDRDA